MRPLILIVVSLTGGAAALACGTDANPPYVSEAFSPGAAVSRPALRDACVMDGDAETDAAPRDCLSHTLADAGGLGCPAACAARCERIAARYLLGVAEAAHACIRRLDSCSEEGDVIPCVDKAMLRACPSAEAPATCAPRVAACDPAAVEGKPFAGGGAISVEGCAVFASALSKSGRSEYFGCLERATDAGTCARSGSITCAGEIRE